MMKMSRILVVDVAIEKIHDNLQHRLKQAYFFASFATKETKTLSFQHLFLLKTLSGLPCKIRLVPMVRRLVIREGI